MGHFTLLTPGSMSLTSKAASALTPDGVKNALTTDNVSLAALPSARLST